MADEYATKDELQAANERVTGIVEQLNKVNENGRKYVDEANQAQDKAMGELEKKLVDLFDKKLQEHDKSVRKFISEEAAKVAKSFKK
jgi:vacuolar-type H+-ATPase subunit H